MIFKIKCAAKYPIIIVLLLAVIVVATTLIVIFTRAEDISPARVTAAVVTNGKECSKIGTDILGRGGTAVDAAIAALVCEGLMMPQSMGIGGGFLMTIYSKSENKGTFLIARERAPKGAKFDMFNGNETMAKKGILSVAVPGELRGYWEAYNKYGGKVLWKDLIQPSIDLCLSGIRVTQYFSTVLEGQRDKIFRDPGLKAIFFNPKTGDVYKEGDFYTRPKLAKTLKIISEEGGDALHNGTLTKKFVDEIKRLGGIITEEDMNNYKVEWQKPITITLPENRTLYTATFPGSGVILGFMLNILKGLITHSNPEDVETYQNIVESFKFGFGRRTEFGDLSFLPQNITELAYNLTTDAYADHIRQKIFDDRTFQNPEYYGATTTLPEDHGTANLAILASNGDAVSVTSTINLYFGASILLQDTGIILNDEMDDFSSPNITNDFGIPPSLNNYIEPFKRPLSSMCPTIVVKDDNVELVVGAAGGTKITTSVALIIIRHIWFNMSLDHALQEKRFHHQVFPMSIAFENTYETEDHYVVEGLHKIGHQYTYEDGNGFSAATAISNKSGAISAAFDRRRQGEISYLHKL